LNAQLIPPRGLASQQNFIAKSYQRSTTGIMSVLEATL
jgi:hypothetical protein